MAAEHIQSIWDVIEHGPWKVAYDVGIALVFGLVTGLVVDHLIKRRKAARRQAATDSSYAEIVKILDRMLNQAVPKNFKTDEKKKFCIFGERAVAPLTFKPDDPNLFYNLQRWLPVVHELQDRVGSVKPLSSEPHLLLGPLTSALGSLEILFLTYGPVTDPELLEKLGAFVGRAKTFKDFETARVDWKDREHGDRYFAQMIVLLQLAYDLREYLIARGRVADLPPHLANKKKNQSPDIRDLAVSTGRRVMLGTVVYVCILVLAAPYPNAAGLMLTFPALNGLGFLYAERGKELDMADAMLLLPTLNGGLCAAYILSFSGLASCAPSWLLALLLFAAIVVIWGFVVWWSAGIAREWQLFYAIAVTVVGAILLAAAAQIVGQTRGRPLSGQELGFLEATGRTLAANWHKIGLFALAFALFLVLSARLNLSARWRGKLAGLPLVPFGGLLSIAASGEPLTERIASLKGMSVGVWLGPAVAVWFIFSISRILNKRAVPSPATPDYRARFAIIASGWIMCGIAIALVTCVAAFSR